MSCLIQPQKNKKKEKKEKHKKRGENPQNFFIYLKDNII